NADKKGTQALKKSLMREENVIENCTSMAQDDYYVISRNKDGYDVISLEWTH
ncbi:hypothetical protein KI387_009925, partial [Taxus chinensis]